MSTIRFTVGVLVASMLAAGCNKKLGGKLPRTKLPPKAPFVVEEDPPPPVDLEQEVSQLYESDWRGQKTSNPALETAAARAKEALDELVKAGAIAQSSLRTHVQLIAENLDADGMIKPDVLAQLRLAGVEELDLGTIPVTDPGMLQLKILLCLKQIRTQSEKITDAGFEGFEPLKSLEQLSCFAAPGSPPLSISGEGFKFLERHPNLKTLDVRRAAVNGGWLIHLARIPSLTSLYLDENKITDLGIVHLRALTRLKFLSLDKNPIVGTGMKELAVLPELAFISLNHCPVKDAAAEALASLKPSTLSLSDTKLTDAAGGALGRIRTLKTLNLSYTAFTNAGVQAFAGLPELEEIDLRGDKVTDACLSPLGSCPKLNLVSLTKTPMATVAVAFKWEHAKPGAAVKFCKD